MPQLTELNKISIAIIVFYVPAFLIAILLCIRHGFGRSSGWVSLVLLGLIRLLGAALELATISNPTNISIYVAAATLQAIAIAPLVIVMLGLIDRVVGGISHNSSALVTPKNLRFIQLLVMVGLILCIVGGTDLSSEIGNAVSQASSSTGGVSYTMPTVSIAGVALIIAGFGCVILATIVTSLQIRSAEPGEKRLLLAVALAMPFVLVRIVFSALGTFGSNPNFKTYGGSPHYATYFVAMAIAEEMAAVTIFEAVGLTLHEIPKGTPKDAIPMRNIHNQRRVEERRY
jgi:hypothetical protein